MDDYLVALEKEIRQRSHVLQGHNIETIYFGGGTPSVLNYNQIQKILSVLQERFNVSGSNEISLEANPDDLTANYLLDLKRANIHRLSIGVQSFQQDDLSLMRRSHSDKQSRICIEDAAAAGFDDINIDLIYGVPGLSLKNWEHNLHTATDLPVQHISAYHLTYEEGTVFHHWRKKGRLKELSENTSIEQFILLRKHTEAKDFEHYEISNFARKGYRSKHNTSYWEGKKYLGFGPAAHSFTGQERSWNVASLKQYIEALDLGKNYSEKESLSERDRFNDYLITSLRTSKGICERTIREDFGEGMLKMLMKKMKTGIEKGIIKKEGGHVSINQEEWLKADMIIRELITL